MSWGAKRRSWSSSIKQSSALRMLLFPALAARRTALRFRSGVAAGVLENLGEMLCEDPVVRVPEFKGRFAMGRQSALFRRLAMTRSYEPELASICADHLIAGRDAIDVGANIGMYSVLMAKSLPGRRVLAIEPTPGALNNLRKNLALNAVADRVQVYAGAASDRAGSADIKVVAGREEYSSLGELSHPSIVGAAFESIQVPMASIDMLVRDAGLSPGFIKIDVEGMEHVVLRGARETLAHHRPIVLAELSEPLLRRNASSAREVLEFLCALGYGVSDPLEPEAVVGNRAFGDVLGVPRPWPAPAS